ncbi:MAG: hypothetical protein ACM3S2_02950 [Ignavibacteriales bacterium]
MKKINLVAIIGFLLIIAQFSFAQEKDSLGYYDLKKMSYEDALRIFGPITGKKLNKLTGESREIKDIIIKGNKIKTILYNYGSICAPSSLPDITDLVWNGLGYGFEFGVLAGAEVTDVDGNPLHIISDSHVRASEGDYDSKGQLKWGWLPKGGYSDPTQGSIASLNAEDKNKDGKPDSWPEGWYSSGAGKYLWPAFLGDMATAPDEEVYYAMDDYTNYEFQGKYFPFPSDDKKGGLGLDASVRILQFNNPMAEDIVFSVYQITNASEKDLQKVYFGMFGDPHIGGSSDASDDMSFFIPPKGELADRYNQRARSMVYSWDNDGKGNGGKEPGYFGWKFLESPSDANNAIDDDDDGIKDESPFNGRGVYIDGVTKPFSYGVDDSTKYVNIYGAMKARWSGDEDGDWDPKKHDVGIDGIGPESKNYPGPDFGEGDGMPSQAWFNDLNGNGVLDPEEKATLTEEALPGLKWAGSEPNFGYRDVSESDQMGLTGFTAAAYDGRIQVPKNDDLIWQWFTKGEIDPEQPLLRNAGDNVFCFSTGPMTLKKGETQRFSMAIIMGENLQDLILNSITSMKIVEADYRFAQPPAKPIVRAVPGDHKVTLYWDAKSEESVDPLTGEKDFEGYKIYRSRDFNFSDVYKITDANGNPFLGQPLFDPIQGRAAQFDLVNDYSGLAQKEYEGRGVKYNLGSNTGLVHQFTDSTVQNGIKYYYAVVAYDRGAINKTTKVMELPPTETQAVIQQDPLTGKLIYDVNTVEVIPGIPGTGTKDASAGTNGIPKLLSGVATGDIQIKVMEDKNVQDKMYKIFFPDTLSYNVLDSTGVSYDITGKDTVLVTLNHSNIQPGSLELRDAGNNVVDPKNYIVNYATGQLGGKVAGALAKGVVYKIKYRYYPVFNSKLMNFEDGNPVFDGLRVFVRNKKLGIDQENSKFLNNSNISVKGAVMFPSALAQSKKVMLPEDWEVRWNDLDTVAGGNWKNADSVKIGSNYIKFPFTVYNVTKNEPATIYFYESIPSTKNNKRWDWGEYVILMPQGDKGTTTSYQFTFTIDTTKKYSMPKKGDIFQVRTSKPFAAGNSYLFETTKSEYSPELAQQSIDNIYVVPNPYVAFGASENPGRTGTKKGDRELQFRNLPPKCTIRIYTMTGELVDVIEKDDLSSIASWALLTKEGMRISYGVYLYHVDVPGVGEKIGKFAVIK